MTFPLMLFAAGFGTRMKDLTRNRPKAMVEVAGRPLIDHAAELARNAGIERIVANTHYRSDILSPHLRSLNITESHETPDILNTGGGLRRALPLLGDGPVLTMNTDAIFTGINPFQTLFGAWQDDMSALLLVVPTARARGRLGAGDFSLDAGRLVRDGELVFTGVQIIRPRLLTSYTEHTFSLSQVWTDLANAGALHGVVHPGEWADVGHPGGIAEAEALLRDV